MASADVTTALEAARRAAARWGPSIFDDLLATLGAHGNEHTALGASRAASMLWLCEQWPRAQPSPGSLRTGGGELAVTRLGALVSLR